MKVILTKDGAALGTKGDVVEVAAGYARNYLVPRSLAVKATTGSMHQAEAMRRTREEAERRILDEAGALGQSLVGTRVVIAARASDEGKLFGSIGAGDISEAIKKFTGVDVERSIIAVEAPIKEIGLHEVQVQPHPKVVFPVTLDVIPA